MFILRLRPEPNIDAIKALRWLLKKAKRIGLKAIEVTEEEGGRQTEKQANENRQSDQKIRRVS
jgi:hypothetical protein